MDARASELAVSIAQRIFTHAVVVEDERKPRLRPIQDLAAQTRFAAQSAIRLPSVNDPGFNLQFVGGEPLDPHTIEKPRCVGGNIGRLVSPVIEIVVTKETDVGNENS